MGFIKRIINIVNCSKINKLKIHKNENKFNHQKFSSIIRQQIHLSGLDIQKQHQEILSKLLN
jgi:hypothetical protein